MKEIKLTRVSVSAGFLLLVLILGGGNLWAQSCRMTSDVIGATGGGAQSANFALKASAGGQGSPVGPYSSPNFSGGGGWVYVTEPEFVRGDANGDGVIDLGDVILVLNFLFKSGPAPCPMQAGDANSDGTVDLGDAVYLLNYLFKGGPAPCSGGKEEVVVLAEMARLKADQGHAEVWLSSGSGFAHQDVGFAAKFSPQGSAQCHEISVLAKFDREVAGVQLEIEFDPDQVTLLDPSLTPFSDGLQLFAGVDHGLLKMGMVDLTGENLLPAGEASLVVLRAMARELSSIKIRKVLLIDRHSVALKSEIPEELSLSLVKETDSRPESFSLSQNYPNPFNPQTSINYSLPEDGHVKFVVYNITGQKVITLVDERQSAGRKTVRWDGKDEKGNPLASGVYFYRLEADKFIEVKKMSLVK
jgi:hypothetical protein